ncbi:MAG: hypothetical protein KKA64_00270 [Nanoarchaeota archaeon]|nr:hypothetical protein [Nanoarchaeota archaeon]
MAQRIFDFCGRFNVGIRASESLLDKIGANIQTGVRDSTVSPIGTIDIHEPQKYETIIRDKRYPYLTLKVNPSTGTTEYYRYNTFVRDIRVARNGDYEVNVNTEGDEAAGLICFRNFCNGHISLAHTPLVHASLVNLNGEGVLMSGDSRAGKTTLMIYLMQHLGSGLISEDNVYLEKDMKGLYFPKVPRVRFSTVRDSCLSPLLTNLQATEATQYWDVESIERVVAEGNLDVDGGLAISRRKIAEMCEVGTSEAIQIDRVIFPSYSEGRLSFEKVDQEEGFKTLERFGREKKKDLDSRDIGAEPISLKYFERRKIRFYRLKFGGLKSLVNGGFVL